MSAPWAADARPPLAISGGALSAEEVAEVARGDRAVALAPAGQAALEASFAALASRREDGGTIYGTTTGVGALDGRAACAGDDARQRALLRSHAAGVGDPAPAEVTRAAMLARASQLCQGASGASPQLVRALFAFLRAGVTPRVPSLGSVGASDLAPLAHIGLSLIGEGEAECAGERLSGERALARAGLEPLALRGRDGFALINGLAYSAGSGALATVAAGSLVTAFERAAALGLCAVGGLESSYEARVVGARPHPGASESAARLRALLEGREAPKEGALREPLSSRCVPQVAGAAQSAAFRARCVVETELAAAVDNPMITADGFCTNNAGNSHGQELAEALDGLANALISLAAMSERRVARLVDGQHSGGLPLFLIAPGAEPGACSGFMIAQVTAASLVGELRTSCAAPASIQSIPTGAGTEDHVSMSAAAAARARRAAEIARLVVAIELLVAAQAADLAGARLPPALSPTYEAVRARVPMMVEDRPLGADIERAATVVGADLRGG